MVPKRLAGCILLGLALARWSVAADERPYVFFPLEIPGAVGATATGINARGDVVGNYFDGTRVHGFALREGVLTTIDYPGAAFTDARGIGPRGEIVGSYRLPGEPGVNQHGYLLTPDGEFLPADYPGHTNTIPQRILPDGTILGCRHDWDFMATMRGVVMGRHGSDEIDAFASMHNGATPDLGRIAGLFTDMMTGAGRGYIIADGTFVPFDVPGSIQTAAWDMSPAGAVVGNFRLPGGAVRGFLLEGAELDLAAQELTGGRFTTLHVPGSSITTAFGINARGDVVGSFVSGGVSRAYIATRRAAPAR